MKFKVSVLTTIKVALVAAVALPFDLAAQHTRNSLIDLGTFGGPENEIAPNAEPRNPGKSLTSRYAFRWKDANTPAVVAAFPFTLLPTLFINFGTTPKGVQP